MATGIPRRALVGPGSSYKRLERTPGNPSDVLNSYSRRLGEPLSEHPLFRQALEAHLAEDLEDELEKMSAHAVCLLDHLVSIRHERPRAYLARVGACYLRGLDTEAVVMAGAVLDAAMQETFDDTEIREAGIRCGRYVSLGNRVEYAVQSGVLTETEGEKVHTPPKIPQLPKAAYPLNTFSHNR